MTSISTSGRRFSRRLAVASCALGAVLAQGGAALADTTVSTATTATLLTSTAGNVTITSAGSIALGSAETNPGVTIDSGTESVTNGGLISGAYAGQIGVSVTTATTGAIINTGTISTGTAQVVNSDGSIATAAVLGGPAVQVNADLGQGISNTGTISTVGANAIVIQPAGASVELGVVDNTGTNAAEQYGLYNTGSISSSGGTAGLATTTILIGGDATYTTILDGGINNTGSISGSAVDTNATAIEIGQNATVDTILNSGTITATTAGDTIPSGTPAAGDATAIQIDSGATVNTITNNGTISASASYAGSNATAITDLSGTLTTVTNDSAATISAVAGTGGTATAINLTAAGATVANSGIITGNIDLGGGGSTLSNDSTGTITGDIAFGGGNNFLTQTGGTITGNIDWDTTDEIDLSGGAVLSATSTGAGGTLVVGDGTTGATFIAGSGGAFNATTATFNTGSVLSVDYDPTGATTNGSLATTGTTTFNDPTTTTISVNFTSYLATTANITLIDATGGIVYTTGDLADLQSNLGNIGIGYNTTLDDTAGVLSATVTRKAANDPTLNYTGNLAAIYDAAPNALVADTELGAAFGNISSYSALRSAYTALLPDLSGAREETAIRVQDIAGGFINDRLNLLRVADQGVGDGGGDYENYRHRHAGFWAQEAVSDEKGKGGLDSQNYSGTMYDFTIGYDKRDDADDIWGVSMSYAALTYNTPTSPSDDLAQSIVGQIYHGMNRGPLFWDAIGTLAWNSYQSHRQVTVSTVSRTADARWNGYQGGLATQVGYAAQVGGISIRPSVGATYTFLGQTAYTEENGGAGVDLAIDSNTFQSLRTNAEIRFSTIFSADPQFVPYLRGGISHEFLDAKPKADGSFAGAGGTTFSLEGDPLNKDTPYVGLGLTTVGGFSRLSVEYTGQFGDRVTSHQAAATISMDF